MKNLKKISCFVLASLYICILSSKSFISSQETSLSLKDEIEKSNIFNDFFPKKDNQGNSNNSNDYEDENNEEDNENEFTRGKNSNQFSWFQHPEDHGEYAGSAVSSKSMSHFAEKKAELDAIDPVTNPLNAIDYAEKEWQLFFRSLDRTIESMSSSPMFDTVSKTKVFDQIFGKLSQDCQSSLMHIANSARRHRIWALRMLDSNGKLPSGLTYGRFAAAGDYEECIGTNIDELVYPNGDISAKPTHHRFHGKYCLIDFRLPMPEKPKDIMLSIHNSVIDFNKTELPKIMPDINKYAGYSAAFYSAGYNHPVCLPSTCDINNVTQAIGEALEGIHILVKNEITCQERFVETPIRTSQKISLFVFALMFGTSFVATAIQFFIPDSGDDNQIPKQRELSSKKLDISAPTLSQRASKFASSYKVFANCCSIQANFARLTKPDPKGMTSVHYIRIVAMALTVITHTAALGTLQAITKPADMRNTDSMFRDLLPQMLANAFQSIQIFFFMAGFMLVVSTYPTVKRQKGKLLLLDYCLKRAIRLWPGLIVTICMNFVWPLFVDGPTLNWFVKLIVDPCEKTWWHTLGFVSNFDHVEKMCLRHSYFAASDYQLHIMAYPLILLLYRQPMAALSIAGLLTVCGFVAQVIMVTTKPLFTFMMVDYLDLDVVFNTIHYFHHPVWNHMSAFFYGFITGYLIVKQIRFNISEKTATRISLFVLPLGFCAIFAPYFWNHYKRPIEKWQMIVYAIVDRLIVLSICAWIAYAALVLSRKPKKQVKTNAQIESEKSKNVGTIQLNNQLDQPRIKLDIPIIIRSPSDFGSELGGLRNGNHGLTPSPSWQSMKQVLSVASMNDVINNEANMASGKSETSIPSLEQVMVSSNTSFQSLSRHQSSPNFNKATELYLSSRPVLKTALSFGEVKRINSKKQSSSSLTTNSLSYNDLPEQSNVTNYGKQIDGAKVNEHNMKNNQVKPQEGQTRRRQTILCNVNILCLMLSRLTFQLYLFNMVVLWIDVTHSKYTWHFSYYFIIMKSTAIYIMSALFATVFFVVFESPTVAVFILWSKSRAAKYMNPKKDMTDVQTQIEKEVSFSEEKQMTKDSSLGTKDLNAPSKNSEKARDGEFVGLSFIVDPKKISMRSEQASELEGSRL